MLTCLNLDKASRSHALRGNEKTLKIQALSFLHLRGVGNLGGTAGLEALAAMPLS
jgi:hypothetical protein